jgi:hypothetical protein
VSAVPDERTALLVIRAWIEANGEAHLRARITQTAGTDGVNETSRVAASKSEITDAVAAWLDEFLDDGALTEP